MSASKNSDYNFLSVSISTFIKRYISISTSTSTFTSSSLFLLFFTFTFCSCSLLRTLTGTELDPEQFAKAREATLNEIRLRCAESLQKRLISSDPIDNAGVVMFIQEEALNKAARVLDSTRGWLNQNTRMLIRSIRIKLYNGVAIASLALDAVSDSYPVAVKLNMDCVLYLTLDEKQQLVGRMEAVNISPDVAAGGILHGSEEMIRNIVSIKLARLDEQLPSYIFPVDFKQQTAIDTFESRSEQKVNITLSSPRRLLNSTFQLKEILIFQSKLLIALNVKQVEVK